MKPQTGIQLEGQARIQHQDAAIGKLAIVYGVLAVLAWIIQLADPEGKPYLVALVLGAFCLHALCVRKHFADPLLFFGLAMFLYSYLPLVAQTSGNRATLGFPLKNAYELYTTADLATLFGIAITLHFMPERSRRSIRPPSSNDEILAKVAILGAILSFVLSLAYVALYGIVLGGDVTYAQGFEKRLQAGTGILLLSIPLAMTAYSAALVMRRKSTLLIIAGLSSILMLAVALGQRKYFLQIFLLTVAATWRPRRGLWIIAALASSAILFVVFAYLGHLRIHSLPIGKILDVDEWDRFFTMFDQYLGNETVALYATAASATSRLVAPLPYLGDYLLSWQMSLPQTFFQTGFSSLNDRFGKAYDPAAASAGAGWGFSFIGEAYLSGGHALICVVIILELLLFRYIYIRGNGAHHRGAWGVFSLCSLYFSLWVQRNAFAFFFKEFLVYQALIIGALFFIARHLSSESSSSTQAARTD
ncbi:hypothetical protein ABH995_005336 [Bradyrhizobium yuanmingense]|uniref:O-antigen polysaccharide polymerase Wzy n=1 Tax=Bradyrhizobium yuanmingense TaxID=108015 RepID=UPI003517316F